MIIDGYAVKNAAVNRLVKLCDNIKMNIVRFLSHFLSLVGKNMD